MEANDFVLSVISASGGNVQGRTLLQKRCYFVALLLGSEGKYGFQAHYYGPFSSLIDGALSQLVAAGFVDERRIRFGAQDNSGFEIRRHDYTLTEDGREIVNLLELEEGEMHIRIRDAVRKLEEAGNLGYVELSIAAKALYIIKKKDGPTTKDEIRREAHDFGWNIKTDALNRAIDYLEKLKLIENR